MKKRKLEERLRQAELTIQSMRSREQIAQVERYREFEEAINEMATPVSVVKILTSAGHVVSAQVVRVEFEQAEVSLSSFNEELCVPGLRSVEIRLAPHPG